MNDNDKINSLDDVSKDEIKEAVLTDTSTDTRQLEETAEELKRMGVRDINEIDMNEEMKKAMNNVQVQKTLHDIKRGSKDDKSPRDYLENYLEFLVDSSPDKAKAEVANGLTVEHAKSVLKTSAKIDLPEAVIKKHLKNLRKKFK